MRSPGNLNKMGKQLELPKKRRDPKKNPVSLPTRLDRKTLYDKKRIALKQNKNVLKVNVL